MAYKKITENGKTFIKHVVLTANKNILSGNKTMVGVDYTRYFQVFNMQPQPTENFNWKMRNPITLEEYSNNLIKWYDKYANQYQLDANVLAAQTYQESKYRIWDFSSKTRKNVNGKNMPYFPAALGLTQFTPPTIKTRINSLNNEEKNKIFFGLTDTYINSNFSFDSRNTDAQLNIPILLQNLIDNPEIAVKLHVSYMKYCSRLANGLASSALFGYNRGPDFIKKSSYTDTINETINRESEKYSEEGIDYVFKIFSILGDKENNTGFNKPRGYYFGYDKLEMKLPPSKQAEVFNSFDADINNDYI